MVAVPKHVAVPLPPGPKWGLLSLLRRALYLAGPSVRVFRSKGGILPAGSLLGTAIRTFLPPCRRR